MAQVGPWTHIGPTGMGACSSAAARPGGSAVSVMLEPDGRGFGRAFGAWGGFGIWVVKVLPSDQPSRRRNTHVRNTAQASISWLLGPKSGAQLTQLRGQHP